MITLESVTRNYCQRSSITAGQRHVQQSGTPQEQTTPAPGTDRDHRARRAWVTGRPWPLSERIVRASG